LRNILNAKSFDEQRDFFLDAIGQLNEAKTPRFSIASLSTEHDSFDYSPEEWAAIDAAVIKLRPSGLSDHDRRFLRTWAMNYRLCSAQPAATVSVMMEQWVSVWRLIEKLEDRLKRAVDVCFGGQPPVKICAPEFYKRPVAALPPQIYDFDHQLAELSSLKKLVAECAAYLSRDGAIHTAVGPARDWYYSLILTTWQQLGGRLAISRHPVSGKVGGPLARFFWSVAAPVMGKEAPSVSSIPGIVAGFKRRAAATEKEKAEHDAVINGIKRLI
jgi:hypothetical protein